MPRHGKVGQGIAVAILSTFVWVAIWAFSLHLKHMQVLLLGMAVILYFIPGSLSYAGSFIAVRLLEGLFSARGGIVQILLAGCLPAAVPMMLMRHDADMWQYAAGMLPGGLSGAAIAFWPQKPEDVGERIEPVF